MSDVQSAARPRAQGPKASISHMTRSDFCFLVAAVLFGLVVVYSVVKDNVSGAMYAAGLAAIAIGLLVAP